MSKPRVEIRMPPLSAFNNFERETKERMQAAALNATHIAAARAKTMIRREMVAADLGRLGNAVDCGSDLEKSGAVRSRGTGFSASGWVFVRSRSERTLGAIEAYTQGADIAPRRGRYLWIPGDDIPARAGRTKVTPENYKRFGLEAKIGPLTLIWANGRPLLVVKGASVSGSGKARSAKSLRKDGGLRKGQVAQKLIVAFIGIPRTSRQARIDVPAIMKEAQAMLPALLEQQLNKR